MARARNIKPDFFLNEDLGHLPPLARLLFAGLWCMADREGRLRDSPERIKIQILPYDKKVNVDKLLDLLNGEFITRYEVDGQKCIQINNFNKHQNPHKKERASEIPAAPESTGKAEEKPEQAPDKHHASPVQEQEMHSTSPADSLNLIPDSLNQREDSPYARAREAPLSPKEKPPDDKATQLVKLYVQLHGKHNERPAADGIVDWLGIAGPEIVEHAIRFASERRSGGGKPWGYVEQILRGWDNAGLKSVADIKASYSQPKPSKGGRENENPDSNRDTGFVPSTGFRKPEDFM